MGRARHSGEEPLERGAEWAGGDGLQVLGMGVPAMSATPDFQ
jgi:hypothetical protein